MKDKVEDKKLEEEPVPYLSQAFKEAQPLDEELEYLINAVTALD